MIHVKLDYRIWGIKKKTFQLLLRPISIQRCLRVMLPAKITSYINVTITILNSQDKKIKWKVLLEFWTRNRWNPGLYLRLTNELKTPPLNLAILPNLAL